MASGTTADLYAVEDDIWGTPIAPWIVGAGGYAALPNAALTVWTPVGLGLTSDLHDVQQPGAQETWFAGDNGVVDFRLVTTEYHRGVSSPQSVVLLTPGTMSPVAIGSGGTVYDGTASGGTSWSIVHQAGVPARAALGGSSDVFMVGDGGTILKTTYAWSSWTTQASGTSANLTAIFGATNGTMIVLGEGGTILRTTNGGATWTTIASPTTANLRGGSFSKALTGRMVAVGDHGTVLRSTDAGLTWCVLDAGTTVDLLDVTALDDNRIIAVGRGGTILKSIDGGGACATTSVGEENAPMATMSEPFPNPMRGSATVRFAVAMRGPVDVAVYDAAGRRVRALETGVSAAGRHEVTWDARDDRGHGVAAGLYFVRVRAGAASDSRRIVVAR